MINSHTPLFPFRQVYRHFANVPSDCEPCVKRVSAVCILCEWPDVPSDCEPCVTRVSAVCRLCEWRTARPENRGYRPGSIPSPCSRTMGDRSTPALRSSAENRSALHLKGPTSSGRLYRDSAFQGTGQRPSNKFHACAVQKMPLVTKVDRQRPMLDVHEKCLA